MNQPPAYENRTNRFYLPPRLMKKKTKLSKGWVNAFRTLGEPKNGYIWLTPKLGSGGIPQGKFMSVPEKIDSYAQVKAFINNLQPTELTTELLRKFRLNKDFIQKNKEELFGYFVGVMIGDASKHRMKSSCLIIDICLSKKHEDNLRFGDFFALCSNAASSKK